jgi:hypothetical protein
VVPWAVALLDIPLLKELVIILITVIYKHWAPTELQPYDDVCDCYLTRLLRRRRKSMRTNCERLLGLAK